MIQSEKNVTTLAQESQPRRPAIHLVQLCCRADVSFDPQLDFTQSGEASSQLGKVIVLLVLHTERNSQIESRQVIK